MSRSRRSACETSVTKRFLATIVGMSVEHRLALVRVDPQRGDHVQQRVGVDVLLVRVAAEHELELGRGHQLADDVDDVVADDPLGGGEVADAHADDPAIDLRQRGAVAPLLDVTRHRDVLGLPVVGLHRAVQLVRPAVAQREQVERHRLAAADHALGRQRRLGLLAVEHERAVRRRCSCSALLDPSLEDDTTRGGQATGLVPPSGDDRASPLRDSAGVNRTSLTAAPPGMRGSGNLRGAPDGTVRPCCACA